MRWALFLGEKYWKAKWSVGMPELTSAVTMAQQPGMERTGMPSRTHSRTRLKAGSAMPGVPASLTRAMSPSFLRYSTYLGVTFSLLKSW